MGPTMDLLTVCRFGLFIVLNDSKFLDNHIHVFGKVVEKIYVVDKITNLKSASMEGPAH